MSLAWRASALLFATTVCACSGGDGGETSDGDVDLDASGSDSAAVDDAPAVDGGRDGGAADTAVSGDTAKADTASATDTASPPDTGKTDVGGGDTGVTCKYTKDADGFFTLTSPKSDYVVRLPPGYEAAPKPTPLLLAFHGCGDTAYNFATWAVVPYALRTTQDYIAASLGGRDGACWTISSDTASAFAALAQLQGCFQVDAKKVVVAGYSSGGGMAFSIGLKNAAQFAGILIENSGLSQAVGSGSVATVLGAAAWKINIAQSARISDGSYAIAGIRSDRDKMLAASFPLQYRELDGTHDGSSDDWSGFLIPKMATWTAP